MIFNLSIGFAQLRNPSSDDAGAAYALFIGDTVQVQKARLIVMSMDMIATSCVTFFLLSIAFSLAQPQS